MGRGGNRPDKPGKPGRKPPTRPSASRAPTTRSPSSAATRSTNARIRHVQYHMDLQQEIFLRMLSRMVSLRSANAAVTRALNKGRLYLNLLQVLWLPAR